MFNIEFAKNEDQFDYDCFEEIEYLSFDFCILEKQNMKFWQEKLCDVFDSFYIH
jgi:hypothetical protein